jgi:hypothetical protein
MSSFFQGHLCRCLRSLYCTLPGPKNRSPQKTAKASFYHTFNRCVTADSVTHTRRAGLHRRFGNTHPETNGTCHAMRVVTDSERQSRSMCDCDSTLITDVPLLYGETVLLDFPGDGGFCGCSAECCPRSCGRLTNRRIIVLQRSVGVPVLATALLEDVTACLVGRQRPRWWMILPLFFTGCLVVFLALVPSQTSSQSQEARNEAVIPAFIGFSLMGLAVWIFMRRPTAINFFVKGSTDSDNGFSITVANRGAAIGLLGRFFAAKAFTTSVGSPVANVLAAGPSQPPPGDHGSQQGVQRGLPRNAW